MADVMGAVHLSLGDLSDEFNVSEKSQSWRYNNSKQLQLYYIATKLK